MPDANAKGRGARFDRRDVALERHARRVLRAAVLEAGVRLAEAVLHVRRGLIDRRDDRARRRIGLLSGVNANRLKRASSLSFIGAVEKDTLVGAR
jgi:hypothetical protein